MIATSEDLEKLEAIAHFRYAEFERLVAVVFREAAECDNRLELIANKLVQQTFEALRYRQEIGFDYEY